MNVCLLTKVLLFFFLFIPTGVRGSENDPMRQVVEQIRTSVETNDFSTLTIYVTKFEKLYWGVCNSDGSVELTVDEMNRQLSRLSRKGRIRVNDISSAGLIETTGWSGESSYIYFDITKEDDRWNWRGVCESTIRSIDFISGMTERGR
jgi:hypothetical protein